jgi:hypothetical protein
VTGAGGVGVVPGSSAVAVESGTPDPHRRTDEFGAAKLSYPLKTMDENSARGGRSAREEDVMHPVITQAVAAERVREIHAHAVATRRGRQLRRSRQARRLWLLAGISRAGRGPVSAPVPRPVRGPRAA